LFSAAGKGNGVGFANAIFILLRIFVLPDSLI
jgi:hypothetical protein